MKISVIVVTARLGGFDVLCNSMRAQTGIDKSDWELIVVDDWHDDRILVDIGMSVRHLKPRANDYLDPCYANNLAIRLAQGELVVFFCDQEWAYPTFLADHWRIYQEFPGYTFSGFLDRYPMPTLKADITRQNSQWSIFESEFTESVAAEHFKNQEPVYRERKGGTRGPAVADMFEMPGDFVYFNVDSLPMAVIRDLNGLDERYDGGYGICDIDLGWRANRIGWKFLARDDGPVCNKLGMRSALVNLPRKPKKELRSVEENRAFFHRRQDAIRSGKEAVSIPQNYGAWRWR